MNNLKNEELFFKVFKNKYLFCKIFSNFKKLENYDSLLNLDSLLKRGENGIGIIRDKVKCGIHLYSTTAGYLELFKTIKKDNIENKIFYTQFFQLYKNYYSSPSSYFSSSSSYLPSKTTFEEELILSLVISSGNKVAFGELVSEYSKFLKKETLEYILNKFVNNKISIDIIDTSRFNIKGTDFKPLKGNLQCDFLSYQTIKMLNYFSDTFRISLDYSGSSAYFMGKPNIFDFSLKKLIVVCKFIIDNQLLNNSSNSVSTLNNNSNININNNFINNNLSDQLNQFTKQQLKSNPITLLKSDSQIADIVLDYYNIIYLINKNNKILYELTIPICYNSIYNSDNQNSNCINSNNNKDDNCNNIKMEVEELLIMHNQVKDNEIKYFIREGKLNNLRDFKNFLINSNQYYRSRIGLHFIELLKNNQFEFLELLKSRYGKIIKDILKKDIFIFPIIVGETIVSTLIIDNYFKYYRESIFREGNSNWTFIRDWKLLEYFESKMIRLQRKFGMRLELFGSSKLFYEKLDSNQIVTQSMFSNTIISVSTQQLLKFNDEFIKKNNQILVEKIIRTFEYPEIYQELSSFTNFFDLPFILDEHFSNYSEKEDYSKKTSQLATIVNKFTKDNISLHLTFQEPKDNQFYRIFFNYLLPDNIKRAENRTDEDFASFFNFGGGSALRNQISLKSNIFNQHLVSINVSYELFLKLFYYFGRYKEIIYYFENGVLDFINYSNFNIYGVIDNFYRFEFLVELLNHFFSKYNPNVPTKTYLNLFIVWINQFLLHAALEGNIRVFQLITSEPHYHQIFTNYSHIFNISQANSILLLFNKSKNHNEIITLLNQFNNYE